MVALVVLLAAGTVGWLLWRWVDSLVIVDAEKRAAAQLDVVKIAASVMVAGGGLFALYLAVRRQRTQELELEARHAELRHRSAELAQRDRVQDHAEQVAEANRLHAARVADTTEFDAAARRVTELYSTSVGQLGSEHAAVRLGGMYALERLAQDNPTQRQTVVNVLCAYLRMPFTEPSDTLVFRRRGGFRAPSAVPQSATGDQERLQEREVRLTAQRLLAVHLTPRAFGPDQVWHPLDTFWADVYLDLSGATLIDFNLAGCTVRSFLANDARFLGHTTFLDATFTFAAGFSGASFTGPTHFDAVTFTGSADFDGATFAEADTAAVTNEINELAADREAAIPKAIKLPHGASFCAATFGGDTSFLAASFAGPAQFDGATFFGTAAFDGTVFDGYAGFSKALFARATSFYGAVFAGPTMFDEATFETDVSNFARATFTGHTRFVGARFAAMTRFDDATFDEEARFDNVLIKQSLLPQYSALVERYEQHQRPRPAIWPPGWSPSPEHVTIDGWDGTWHPLRRIELEPGEPTGHPPHNDLPDRLT
ncbi:pentapeptide repeat-containing protein [Allokutzneria albata]|uniref:pentapeptide repeat-containing protein n=1 Tax=Allokutzneria albata TaxID=211114 RepID=UPI000694567E|nr:pentapeptide repeat-containing protein [Allokutzneria albata]